MKSLYQGVWKVGSVRFWVKRIGQFMNQTILIWFDWKWFLLLLFFCLMSKFKLCIRTALIRGFFFLGLLWWWSRSGGGPWRRTVMVSIWRHACKVWIGGEPWRSGGEWICGREVWEERVKIEEYSGVGNWGFSLFLCSYWVEGLGCSY